MRREPFFPSLLCFGGLHRGGVAQRQHLEEEGSRGGVAGVSAPGGEGEERGNLGLVGGGHVSWQL